jgi:hypothetical protein
MTTVWAAKRTELGTPCFLPCYSMRCFVLDSKHTSHHRQAIKAPQATAFNCLTLPATDSGPPAAASFRFSRATAIRYVAADERL